VINNITSFGDNFKILCKETNLYYFQNQGKYACSSKGLNGWMSVWQNWEKKIAIVLEYIFKFCLMPLHKGEFLSEMSEPQALSLLWMSDILNPSFVKNSKDGTLLLLGIHYLSTIKKKVTRGRGRVTLPTCAI
jgi:hypothetical protein